MLTSSGWMIFLSLFNIITPVGVLLIIIFHNSHGIDYYGIIVSRLASILVLNLGKKTISSSPRILNNIFPGLILSFGLFTTFENLAAEDPKIYELWAVAYFGMFMVIFICGLQLK